MPIHRYLIGIGSNVRHQRFGCPKRMIAVAILCLDDREVEVHAASRIVASPPMGPSRRRYANTVVEVLTRMEPDRLLAHLQRLEGRLGRRRRGQPWSARVIDLDIVLWSGGAWVSPGLVVPHVDFRTRDFVLGPAAAVAPLWRDPVSGLTLRQLAARLERHRRGLTRRASIPR